MKSVQNSGSKGKVSWEFHNTLHFGGSQFFFKTSTLKAIGRLIVENTVLFQISVESPAMKYQCRAKQGLPITYIYFFKNFPRAAILDYITSYGCPIGALPNNSGNHIKS